MTFTSLMLLRTTFVGNLQITTRKESKKVSLSKYTTVAHCYHITRDLENSTATAVNSKDGITETCSNDTMIRSGTPLSNYNKILSSHQMPSGTAFFDKLAPDSAPASNPRSNYNRRPDECHWMPLFCSRASIEKTQL